jgi:SAM-dependent methyltransferase
MRTALVPHVRHSQYVYAERLSAELHGGGNWLDLGCGHAVVPDWASPRQPLAPTRHWRVVGLDVDREALARHRFIALKVHGTAEALPFPPGTFDVVTANMVLEHLERPERVFAEVAQVLRPGGRFIVHTPNRRGYTTRLTRLIPRPWRAPLAGFLHGRSREDVYPAYYLANTPVVLRRLAAAAGLAVAEVEYVQTTAQLVAIPMLATIELLLIRALERPSLSRWRADLIAVFHKT